MNKMRTALNLLKNKERFFYAFADWFGRTKFSHILSDSIFLRIQYRLYFMKKLDLKNPKSFNEKLQWLKLYNRDPMYSTIVDKFEVKKYVSSLIGENRVIRTIDVWDDVDSIDFSLLPSKFVIKGTHDSGSVIVCKDKNSIDIENVRNRLRKSLNNNLYYFGREWPYKNVKPRIIAEEYIEDSATKELRDYKFFCFNGVMKCFKVDFDRFSEHRANYYDRDCNLLRFGELVCPPNFDKKIDFPPRLSEMIKYAEDLSKGFPFLRVDFYYANGEVFFGEMTFFPASGFGKFIPEEWDLKLGSWLELKKGRFDEKKTIG